MQRGDPDVLKTEYRQFRAYVQKSGKKNAGKVIAIKGDEILGLFDSYGKAAESVYAEHEPGTVLIQEVKESLDALTVTIHTPGVVLGA